MTRAVVGVLVGYAVWTAIWLGGNQVLLPEAARLVGEGQAYTEAGGLSIALGLSVVCSLAAGFVTARIAAAHARGALIVTALLLLGTGIGVQAGVWSLMPLWYHGAFLALLVPVTLLGGRLAGGGARAVLA